MPKIRRIGIPDDQNKETKKPRRRARVFHFGFPEEIKYYEKLVNDIQNVTIDRQESSWDKMGFYHVVVFWTEKEPTNIPDIAIQTKPRPR